MELVDTPPDESKRVSKRARGPSGLALENSPSNDSWEQSPPPSFHVMGIRPPEALSPAQTTTLAPNHPPAPPSGPPPLTPTYALNLHNRLEHLETDLMDQQDRQTNMELVAKNLIQSLHIAINRLDSGQTQQASKLITHEQVMEQQHRQTVQTQQENMNTRQQSSENVAINEENVRQTQLVVEQLMNQYDSARRSWEQRQMMHEQETQRLQTQIQQL